MTHQLTEMEIHKSYSAEASAKIDADNPTPIGTSGGLEFHEHPGYGDTAPLIVKQNGRWHLTTFYEVPAFDPVHNELY